MAASMERVLFPEIIPSKEDSKEWIQELDESSRWYRRLRGGSKEMRISRRI
jgi:hypothetical protein